jgi:phosphate transport system permease protein
VLRRRRLVDRLARIAVTGGGLGIIASVLGILAFIAIEVAPLLAPARVQAGPARHLVGGPPAAALCDEYRTYVVVLSGDGVARALRARDGSVASEKRLGEDSALPLARGAPCAGGEGFAASTADGRVVVLPVRWSVTYGDGERSVKPEWGESTVFEVDPQRRPVGAFAAAVEEEGGATVLAQRADGALVLARRVVRANAFTGESESSLETSSAPSPGRLTHLLLGRDRLHAFGTTDGGDLARWSLGEGGLGAPETRSGGDVPVTALALLVGDQALVVGRASGDVEVWFPVQEPDGVLRLRHVRDFPRRRAAIRDIVASPRERSFLTLDASGDLALEHSTSQRRLWSGSSPVPAASSLVYAPKADGAFVLGDDAFAPLRIDNPHPETSLGSLFGKVWYEGHPEPAAVWQSTGSTEAFEPKLSLVPLLAGTLKGTFYSLLLAVPLAILAALYVSQFLHATYRRFVKPAVEIMAALPSVVLGFLAGLWLAPRLEDAFPALLLALLLLPLAAVATGALWRGLPGWFRDRFPEGSEVFLQVAALGGALALCVTFAGTVERLAFRGDFSGWLHGATGLAYDQRNAIVVGIAMGFAVIPILFSIAEDAFSNVPRHLVSASLALGASRWQTALRVVVPTASAGVFAAVMVAFGRAVGETMIVLMATGNTPILDWSPFDGFRTLSANIAVEIPEAPAGGTLYRTLFLAGLLLFVLTFLVNTAAEMLRVRLRKSYAQL